MASSNILLAFFIFFSHLHFHFATSSNSICREVEQKALMSLKGSFIDEHNRLSSWTGRNCCSWYGITCHNRTGFVQMIDLQNDNYPLNFLGGYINSSLLQLEQLEYLDLNYNHFSGIRIPEFLGSLRNLQYLDLHGAGFVGEIPQHLGNLSSLQYLDLQGAGFVGEIPQHLGNLSNLHYLILGGLDSASLSSKRLGWIAGLSSLTYLDLSFINATECDDWLDSINMLSSLSSLRLQNCGLVGLPLSHNLNLTSLVSVYLIGNNFNSALPPSFFNLSSLEDIYISDSDLTGPSPNMFQKLTALKILDLSGYSFGSSFPDSLCSLTSLTQLNLGGCKLQGSIPFCLGNLTNLTELGLGGNDLSGTIPGELGSLIWLGGLDLRENQLSGSIPSTLGNLVNLYYLDISHNSFTGELSAESSFEGLKSLESLIISRNQFTVTSQWIPPMQISDLFMDFVSLGFRSPFPAWLQNHTNMGQLSMRNTSISGVIPDWFQTSFPYLERLDLSYNFLTGPVPTFNNKAIITYLELSNNHFTGNISDELCNLLSMRVLQLANNQLTGMIPSCFGNLWDLGVLDLANNSFSGHIPNELGYLNRLVFLRLNGNKLFGEVPSSLQNLIGLTTLDLGENDLQGTIPSWIGKELINLKYLMLQSNHFSGEISHNLCQLPSLQILNLPNNNLVGIIPPCLGNLSKMQSNDFVIDLLSSNYALLTIVIKGIVLEYSSNLRYAKFISLSGNHLNGKIPDELMDLKGLHSLNLSNNELTGKIPEMIGSMNHLESLDLSMNQLYGTIPQSLARMDDLGYLNLSFNNLSGKIPSGGHIDTLNNASVYEGNGELCGKPTTKSCDDDLVSSKQNRPVDSDDDGFFEMEWIYAGIGPGFAVGFLGVFCLLYFKSSWRRRYLKFPENVYNI